MKQLTYVLIVFWGLCSCHPIQRNIEQVSEIDSTLQVKVTTILENKLSEINALSGQVIIMEVQTGRIKALVGLTRKDSTNYQSCNNSPYKDLQD